MDDAGRLIRQSLVIHPLSPDGYLALGSILRDSGDLAGAERAMRQSLVISPTFGGSHVYLAEVLYFRSQFADALTEANAEAPGAARQAVLAGIHSAIGHRRESDALLAELIRNSDDTMAEVLGSRTPLTEARLAVPTEPSLRPDQRPQEGD